MLGMVLGMRDGLGIGYGGLGGLLFGRGLCKEQMEGMLGLEGLSHMPKWALDLDALREALLHLGDVFGALLVLR